MRVRSIVAGLATTAVAVSVSGVVTMAPASADPDYGTPDANDIVGVGSDTAENAMDNIVNGLKDASNVVTTPGYNAGLTAADARLASFDTVGSATIVLRQGSAPINRPVGSGAGKALLYGAGNNPDVTFARSSSSLNANETAAQLQQFPFALDTLGVAVSGAVASHAPASLTGAQILSIYKGDTTNWNQVGGTSGVIKPYIPQSGSGTRSFFDAQLQALNGGPFTYGGAVDDTMHENTDDVLKSDANAIAPFSLGKQTTLYGPNGTIHQNTVKMEGLDVANGGWSAQRALYNVIRNADLGNAAIQGVFGEDGFICSTVARPLIEAAGFQQLATQVHGGVCGQATQNPTSNFTVNQHVSTTSTLAGKSTRAERALLTATVTGASAPDGTVDFYEGTTLLKSGVPLISGQATYTVTGVVGLHRYTSMFVPGGSSPFDPSQASKSVYVKARSKASESFPAKVAKGVRATGTIKITLVGVTQKATGKVKVLAGKKTIAHGRLHHGKVTLTLPKLKKGKHVLKISWPGDRHGVAVTKKFTITQK